jgi:ABC-2 type transport system permease protein
MYTLQRLLRLWRLYAWLDYLWLTRSFEKFAVYCLGDVIINVAAISSTLLLAERFDGLGPWSKPQLIFMLGYAAMVTGLLAIFCGYNVLFIGRRLGRGQFDHTLLQPQPLWMALLTDGFNPFGASSAFITGLGLTLWASRSLPIPVTMGWLALCACNLLASALVVLAVSFFWGSFAFFAPRAAEEINTPLLHLFDQLKLFPLDGLSSGMLNGLLTVVPVGLVAWYPCRALLGLAPVWYTVWITPLMAVLLALLAIAMFRRGMHHYERIGSSRYRDMGHRG